MPSKKRIPSELNARLVKRQADLNAKLLTHCADMSSFRAANTGSLDVQLWIHAPLCAEKLARTPRRAARSFCRSDHAKDHADITPSAQKAPKKKPAEFLV
jgi:hypothetical protein